MPILICNFVNALVKALRNIDETRCLVDKNVGLRNQLVQGEP